MVKWPVDNLWINRRVMHMYREQTEARKSYKANNHIPHWTVHPKLLTRSGRMGRLAENLVIWHLRQKHWQIWARNYQTRNGEVDIIAVKRNADLPGYPTVAFVEVKSRSSRSALPPELNVTSAKRAKIVKVMKQWIGEHARFQAVYRCDIASVIVEPHRSPRLKYFPNAFCAREQFGW